MKKLISITVAVLLAFSAVGCSKSNNEDGILLKTDTSSISSSDREKLSHEQMELNLQKAISEMEKVDTCVVSVEADSATVTIALKDGLSLTDEDEQGIKRLIGGSSNTLTEEDVTIVFE